MDVDGDLGIFCGGLTSEVKQYVWPSLRRIQFTPNTARVFPENEDRLRYGNRTTQRRNGTHTSDELNDLFQALYVSQEE